MTDKPEEKEAPEEQEGEAKKEEGAEAAPAPSPPPKPVKKQVSPWMGLVAMAFFLGLAIGVGFLVWLLVNTFNLVKEDAALSRYGDGRVVEKLQQEDTLGRGSELLIDKKVGKAARVRFLLRDEARQPVTDAVVEVVMVQPGDSSTPPVRSKLQMLEPGVYRGEVNLEKGGQWEAQILVQEGKNSYQVTRRIVLPEKQPEPAKEPAVDPEKKPQ